MCISVELVTAVLGDHGQRPRDDYGGIHCFILVVNNCLNFQCSVDALHGTEMLS